MQLVALPPADQVPGPHVPHAEPLTNEPGGHSSVVQLEAPGADTVPVAHALQLRSPMPPA
jgi:hypothetical protein